MDATDGALGERLGALSGRVGETNRRIVESGIRLATVIADLDGIVRDIATLLCEEHDPRPGLERCENDIAALQRRLAVSPLPAQERL